MLAAAALAVAGCGGGGSGSALDESLSYLPADTPLALAVSTDVNGEQYDNLRSIVRRFPFGRQVEQQLGRQLRARGDVEPLLGNDFVAGAVDARSFADGSGSFIGAIETKDPEKLRKLVERVSRKVGESHGAAIYETDGAELALAGSALVVADSRRDLETALAAHDGGRHYSQDDFDSDVGEVPGGALVRGFVDVGQLLRSDPSGAAARRVAWVSALRTIGFAATAEKDALEIAFDVRTDPSGLTGADLPFATGAAAPLVVEGAGDVAIGTRDPSRIVRFAEQAAQASDPQRFGGYAAAEAQIGRQLGVGIDRDVLGQLTGDASLVLDTAGHFGLRSTLKDPERFGTTLRKLARGLPRLARRLGVRGVRVERPRAGLYALTGPDGRRLVFGVVDGALVASDEPRLAAQVAAGRPRPVPGAQGSLAIRANAEAIASALVRGAAKDGLGALGAGLLTAPLGQLTGWAETSTSGIRGTLRLGFD